MQTRRIFYKLQYSYLKGVESDKCPSFSKALENGGPIYTPNLATLADGLAVPKVGVNAFATIKKLLDKMIVVKEEWIALAILRLVELEKCVVEGAGAAGSNIRMLCKKFLNNFYF